MNYKNTPRRQAYRLSTPVRLGVAAVAACFISTPVLSNPVNPTVVNGAASFNQAGNVLTVTNSNGAIINWQKFSIQAGETTHFAQTSASSTVLNRVLSDPTAIYGTLSSNGRVWLVNPAGIMVGPGGRVDVAGFVASTLNIRNQDFIAGRNVFINDGNAGNVINQGEIRTPAGGSVYLMGSNVSNEGIITTPKGETILAAGATVTLIDSATPGVTVDITGAEGNATNLGTITAEAGRIGIVGVIVRNSGTLNASSVVNEGGRIFLKASQDAYVDGNGRIVTTGTKGGSVEVLGNRVAVTDNAEIDASGTGDTNADGGRIMVGGDYQGKNADIQNASVTYFGPNATLKANAGKVGDGGTVIVWADDTTRAYGNISARGGANGGDGGFVEVSGKQNLSFRAKVDTLAPHGRTGTLLLDPNDITIVADDGGTPTNGTYGGSPWQFDANGDPSTVGWNTLVDALLLTHVNVTTSDGSITVGADQTYDSTNSLYLLAGGNLNAAGRTVTNTSYGGIMLVAGWDSGTGIGAVASPHATAGYGSIVASGSSFTTRGGAFTAMASDSVTLGSITTDGSYSGSYGGDVFIKAFNGTLSVASISARGADGDYYGYAGGNGGSVALWAKNTVTVGSGGINASGGNGYGYSYSDGYAGGNGGAVVITSQIGNIAVNGNIFSNGGDGGNGDYGNPGYDGGNGGNGGDITLTSGTDIALAAGKTISSVGGLGGMGGDGGEGGIGGAGGAGGDGGIIKMYGGSFISLGANSQILARGGDGGDGGEGGYSGFYGGYVGYGGGIGGVGGDGGTIELKAAAGSITLAASVYLDANGGVGGTGGMGGYDYYGGTGGTGGTGGIGGYITLESVAGGISVSSGGMILARGGNGGMGGDGGEGGYAGQQGLGGNGGGSGGEISLISSDGTITLTSSTLDASGGHGGGYASGGNGGDGGEGGSVYVEGATIHADGTSFLAHGGNAGNGDAYAGYSGGNGGNGGYVGLVAIGSESIFLTNSSVDVSGGSGGRGADSVGYASTTGGGNGGNGGFAGAYSSGAITLASSSIVANGGGGGDGGHDLTGYSGGGNGGNGGDGGQIVIEGSSIAMNVGSSVQAFGGWGGDGGDGFGHNATYTLTDNWGVEICGGSSGTDCDGTQPTTDSHGIPLNFHLANGSGGATEGGYGGYGGNVYGGGLAIFMNATAGTISMSSDSTIYASPGGGGQGGFGWYGGSVLYDYPSYPSSYAQQISWDGISQDFRNESGSGLGGTFGTVSLNATGSISLGRVEVWAGTVNVSAGGAIIDNNGSGAPNILAQNATLTSSYGGAAGELAISTGTEVGLNGSITATVTGGATYGGIDIANSSWDQPTSVTLSDDAASGSATFRQVFYSYSPTTTLYGAGISLSAPSGGFVGLSSNRDLNVDGGTFSIGGGGGGIIGFAANSGILDISSAVVGGSNSVEMSAGTLNIWAPVSGVNISLDGTTTNINAATAATGDLSAGGGVMNINESMTAGGSIQLGGTAININSGGYVSADNNVALIASGTINLYGGGVVARSLGTPSAINGIPYTGIAFVAQNLTADGGYLDAQGLSGNISGLVSGDVTLKNGAYFWAGDDIELVLAGGGSTVSLSDSHFLSDYATGLDSTIYLHFLTRSSGGVFIDGAATTTSLPGGSGFFVIDGYTPAIKGSSLIITYASNATTVDPCASSPDLCNPPSPVTDPVTVGDPCASNPDSQQCKVAKDDEKKKKEKDSFGDEDEEEDDSSQVAQCSV